MVKYLEILDNALHPCGLKSFIMVPALRSLREQNIQTACKETPADDEELTRRMELTKAKKSRNSNENILRYPFNAQRSVA
jgi:hypothetical protein